MPRYSVGGRNTVTGAVIDDVACHLWNPHSTKSCWVFEIGVCSTVATLSHLEVIRTSTAGTTPNNTVTPDGDNSFQKPGITPPTGAVLHFGSFATDPTPQGPAMRRWQIPAAIGAGVIFTFPDRGIEVAAGSGLAVATPVATAFQPCDIYFMFED